MLHATGRHLITRVFGACVQVWVESPSLPDPCGGLIWSLIGPSELALSRQFVGGK